MEKRSADIMNICHGPHGYRMPYESTRWVISPGTRLHPAHQNRRESRKVPRRIPHETRAGTDGLTVWTDSDPEQILQIQQN